LGAMSTRALLISLFLTFIAGGVLAAAAQAAA
jgi:hypothetical protein